MKALYEDIHEATGGHQPFWYDENGVPRYCIFSPDAVPNIYASEAVLFVITCAACGQRFAVADSCDQVIARYSFIEQLAEAVREGRDLADAVSYGDPPFHDDPRTCDVAASQCAGTTMLSDTVCVLEVWRRYAGRDWERWEPEAAGEKVTR